MNDDRELGTEQITQSASVAGVFGQDDRNQIPLPVQLIGAAKDLERAKGDADFTPFAQIVINLKSPGMVC